PRGVGIGVFPLQVPPGPFAGSYSSTVLGTPPLLPPTAYSLPFGAAARARPPRGVGIWITPSAAPRHVSVAGSYSSTVFSMPLLKLWPPTAYSLPFGAAASPRLT